MLLQVTPINELCHQAGLRSSCSLVCLGALAGMYRCLLMSHQESSQNNRHLHTFLRSSNCFSTFRSVPSVFLLIVSTCKGEFMKFVHLCIWLISLNTISSCSSVLLKMIRFCFSLWKNNTLPSIPHTQFYLSIHLLTGTRLVSIIVL